MSFIIAYLILGAVAGLVAGLLGAGGGIFIVPILTWLFHAQSLFTGHEVHFAVGTSLATIIFTSSSSLHAHHRRRGVLWPVFWRLTPGIVAGAACGALIADALSSHMLGRVFGVAIILIAWHLAFGKPPAPTRQIPGTTALISVGGAVGTLSALIGIGGGSLIVPYLLRCRVAIVQAIGTAAAIGLPIALAGSLGFALAGLNEARTIEYAVGFVYLPALAAVAGISVLAAPLGARLAHRLPALMLKRIFASILVLFGLKMLWV